MSRSAMVIGQDLADEILANILPDREVTWTAASLGVDQGDFTRITNRIFELESTGVLEVVSLGRGRTEGGLQVTAIRFLRCDG